MAAPGNDDPRSGLARVLARVRGSALARDVAILWVAEGVTMGASVIQTIFAARWLGPEGYGVAVLVITYASLVFLFLDPRSEEATVKYLAEASAIGDNAMALAVPKVAYSVDGLLAVGGLLLVWATSAWAGDTVIHDGNATTMLLLFSVGLAGAAPATTSKAVLTSLRLFPRVAALRMLEGILEVVLVLVFVGRGWGPEGVVYGSALAVGVHGVVSALVAHGALRAAFGDAWWRSRRSALGHRFGEMLRFMVFTDLTTMVGTLVKQADTAVLGIVAGPREAGFYRLARNAAAPSVSLVATLHSATYPRYAEVAARTDEISIRQLTRRYQIGVGLPIALVFLLAIPFVRPVLEVLVGEEFGPATSAAQLLLVGSAVAILLFWVRPLFLASGRAGVLLATATATSVLAVIGFAVLGDRYGSEGVALSRLVFVSIAAPLLALAYYLRRRGSFIRLAAKAEASPTETSATEVT